MFARFAQRSGDGERRLLRVWDGVSGVSECWLLSLVTVTTARTLPSETPTVKRHCFNQPKWQSNGLSACSEAFLRKMHNTSTPVLNLLIRDADDNKPLTVSDVLGVGMFMTGVYLPQRER